jgi:hypothetical protein
MSSDKDCSDGEKRRPQGSPPILYSSPASTMNAHFFIVALVEAGVDVEWSGDPCGRLPGHHNNKSKTREESQL